MSLVSSASDTTVPQKEQSVNSNISENRERYFFNDEKTDGEKSFEEDKSTYHGEGPEEKKYIDFLDGNSNVDNNSDSGYNDVNDNLRGVEINGLSNERANSGRNKERSEDDTGGESQNGRGWQETKESFAARAQSDSEEAGRGRRIYVDLGNTAVSYTEKQPDNFNSSMKHAVYGIEGFAKGANSNNPNSEFTNSKYSKYLKSSDGTVYRDKFKSANNLDDIILASTNYINEDLKHSRNDKFVEFARGDVLIRAGNADY